MFPMISSGCTLCDLCGLAVSIVMYNIVSNCFLRFVMDALGVTETKTWTIFVRFFLAMSTYGVINRLSLRACLDRFLPDLKGSLRPCR